MPSISPDSCIFPYIERHENHEHEMYQYCHRQESFDVFLILFSFSKGVCMSASSLNSLEKLLRAERRLFWAAMLRKDIFLNRDCSFLVSGHALPRTNLNPKCPVLTHLISRSWVETLCTFCLILL